MTYQSSPYPLTFEVASFGVWNSNTGEIDYFVQLRANFRLKTHVISTEPCSMEDATASEAFDEMVVDMLREVFS